MSRAPKGGNIGLSSIFYSWRRRREDGWEPSEKIVSKRKATKAEIQEAEKEGQAEQAEDQAHIAREIKKKRTTYSDVLNRAATPFEVAYIEFFHQCAVADFTKVKRPDPPAIFSEKYTNEQLSDFLKMIPQNKFYKARIHKLHYESHKNRKGH